jgi:hypothetical protein
MTQHIHEGTPQELAPFLAERPQGRFRLIELEVENEQPQEAAPQIDAKNAAAIAYLDRKLQEEATDDPEEIRRAEEELSEFKRNMNANRAATGERLVYP